MISISSLINRGAPQTEAPAREALSLLLQVIAVHAVHGEQSDYELFRRSMWQLADQLSDEADRGELLAVVGAVGKSLREHSERITRYLRSHQAEYHKIISMLTETIASITNGSDRSIKRLQDVEAQLGQASVVEDVRVLRATLRHCLETIQLEIKQQEDQAAAAVEIRTGIERMGRETASASIGVDIDPVTGLPNRTAAEFALKESAHHGASYYAVAVVANRIQAVNARFGSGVGDRLLIRVCERFRTALSADDCLYRWSEQGLLALLRRTTSHEEVRKEIARITNVEMQETVEIGMRSALLPVSASWSVFPLGRSRTDKVAIEIDRFVTSQAKP